MRQERIGPGLLFTNYVPKPTTGIHALNADPMVSIPLVACVFLTPCSVGMVRFKTCKCEDRPYPVGMSKPL